MRIEYPHAWVIIHSTVPEEIYKVLGAWRGGYLSGDSWRMNSGIVAVEEDDQYFHFDGWSGSRYSCLKGAYGLTMASGGVYDSMREGLGDAVTLMDEDTNWHEIDWKLDVPMSKRTD